MKAVHKYELKFDDEVELDMPVGAEAIHAAIQRDTLCLWARVDPGAVMEKRRFLVAGTGHPLGHSVAGHVGTVHYSTLVFHVFEVKP